MRGIKIGSVFAICGFLVSFVSGLFSHTSILSILLKALICAVSFGLLGFLVDLVFTKFLAGEGGQEFSSEGTHEFKSAGAKQNTTGNLVDITIEDEDLEKSSSDNHFVLSESHQMLHDSDLENQQVASENNASEKENGFVPLKNFETLKSLTGKEAVHPESTVVNMSGTGSGSSSKNDGLDVLPDMNNLTLESDDNSSTDDSDVSTDDEFVSSTNVHKHSDEPTEIKDASLMAKAISSILSGEDS